MMDGVEVISQFPSLSSNEILEVEKELGDRFGYARIPEEYKVFLSNTNGCFYKTNEAEDSFFALKVNLPFIESVGVSGIFGVWQSKYEVQDGIHPEWPELFASNENSKENFDVLPEQMMSFAYEDESSGSLFAMSVADVDFGQIYYYHDDYLYTIIGRKRMIESHGYCYYDRKIEEILKKYKVSSIQIEGFKEKGRLDAGDIILNAKGLTKECVFELERSAFIPVATSLNQFINKLKVISY